MKFCAAHWTQLRSAIEDRGLMRFVSNNGEQAATKIEAELSGAPRAETWDPLMAANFAIWNNALEMGGGYLIFGDEDGNPYCPICEPIKHNSYPAEWWINHAADEQLDRAKELGFVKETPIQ
jgi:hypothetical protein